MSVDSEQEDSNSGCYRWVIIEVPEAWIFALFFVVLIIAKFMPRSFEFIIFIIFPPSTTKANFSANALERNWKVYLWFRRVVAF